MKKTIITLIVIAAVAASVGGYYYTRPGPEPKVSTATVSRGDIVESVGATGTLDAVTSVQVGSQVSGIIQELYADYNDLVKKGQVIARLDPTMLQTQIEQAKANLVRSQADVERLKVTLEDTKVKAARARELFERKLLTKADSDTAEVNVKSTQAQLRSSEASLSQSEASLRTNEVNLEHTVITAPIDGIVISRSYEVGQTVAASFNAPTLFVIAADLTKMKCTANIDESDVGKIRPGQIVKFRVDAYPTEEFQGTVVQVRLQPIVVQNVVTYGTVIEVPNPRYKLKPGMTANVNIEIAKRTNVLRVPNAAVRFRPTEEIFQALKQEVPPEMQRGARMAGGMGGRGGEQAAGRGQGTPGGAQPQGPPAQAPAAQPQGAAAQAQGGPRQTANAPAANVQPPSPGGQRAEGRGQPAFERGGGDRPQGETARGEGFRGQGGQGEGRGFGMGPGGGSDDPERRAQFEERLKQMTPEQREQFMARMKERGGNMGGSPAGRGPVPGIGRAASVPAMSTGSAATIDQLFGPLPTVVTSGRAWQWFSGQKQIKSVRLRLGISDGQYTELVEGELQPGQELVTGILLGTEATNRAGQTASPLMQQQRGPMGGPPGGGRGR